MTRRTSIEDVGSVSKRSVTVRDDRMVFLDSAEGLANISVDDRISIPRRTRPRRPPSSNYTGSPMQIYRDDNGELKYKYGTSNETNTNKPDTSTATRGKRGNYLKFVFRHEIHIHKRPIVGWIGKHGNTAVISSFNQLSHYSMYQSC